MGLYKVQKQGRDENTRRLPYYGNTVGKKDKKTTRHLLHDTVTYSRCRVVFLCFHSCLVFALFISLSLHVVNFIEFLPLVKVKMG